MASVLALHDAISPPFLLGIAAIITAIGSVIAAYASVIAAGRRRDEDYERRLEEIMRQHQADLLAWRKKIERDQVEEDLKERGSGLE